MNQRYLRFLYIIFAVLIGLIVLKKIFLSPAIEVDEYRTLAITFDPAQAYRLEITRAGGTQPLKLVRNDGGWIAPEKWNSPAQKLLIENFLTNISKLTGELRSHSGELLADYGIGDEQATTIEIFGKDGNRLQSFLVGATSPDFESSFLRKAGSTDVYLVNQNLPAMFFQDQAPDAPLPVIPWLDLSPAPFLPSTINTVRVFQQSADPTTPVAELKKYIDPEKNTAHWTSLSKDADFEIDGTKVENFLSRLTRLTAVDIADPQGQGYGFDKPYLTLKMETTTQPLEIVIGNPIAADKGDRYLKTSQGRVLIVPEHALQSLDVDASHFFAANPLKIDAGNLQSIAVKTNTQTITLDQTLLPQNDSYVERLKNFQIKKLLFSPPQKDKKQSPVVYTLEIRKKDGAVVNLQVEKGAGEDYVARLQDSPLMFLLDAGIFSSLFEQLDALNTTPEKNP